MDLRQLSPADLEPVILEHDLVAIEVGNQSCTSCTVLKESLAELGRRHDDVFVGALDIDDHPELVEEMAIELVPVLMLFNDGVLVNRSTGGFEIDAVESLLEFARSVDTDDVRRRLAELEGGSEGAGEA